MEAKEDVDRVTVVESMCPNCQENGETRLLPQNIPYFKTILVSSFSCPHCGHKNNEIQQLSEIQEKGEEITLAVSSADDLDRQVVKSEHARVIIPDLDFEIPNNTQKGISSTVQGMLAQAVDALRSTQPQRYTVDPDVARQVGAFIEKLEALYDVSAHAGDSSNPWFTFKIDDPSGNSFIENYQAPLKDPKLSHRFYKRTIEQTHALGFYEEQSESVGATAASKHGADLPEGLKSSGVACWDLSKPMDGVSDADKNVASFHFPCGNCGHDGTQNMCELDVPGFRKCWIMAFTCDFCGAKSSEVKPSGPYGAQGRRWTLEVKDVEDLNRDILKSDCAGISIPSLDVELEPGTLGGLFSTVEGLLVKIIEEINNKFPFMGDSQLTERKARMLKILDKMQEYASGRELGWTIILDDPADHSYIGRPGSDHFLSAEMLGNAEPAKSEDQNLSFVCYDRSFAQNDELGLNDMKVD